MSPFHLVPAADACDCHVHVFDPQRFPYAPARAYTPPPAGVEALQKLHAELGIGRAVLVQPSCYGYDNRALCAALQALGPGRARAVAVLDVDAVPDDELARLHDMGVRGLRLNFHVHGGRAGAQQACVAAAARIGPLGWHLQLHTDPQTLALLAPVLCTLATPVVLDHFGGGPAAAATLAGLAGQPHVWIKLSAPYRVCRDPAELAPLVRRLLEQAHDRLVWASDWPHTGGSGGHGRSPTGIEPFRAVDVGATLRALRGWVADEALFHALMVGNPARLYGF
ncbi:amidohydrolase [Bordetella sp. BOR01]|uniref:amidohydrolase family protein n=1 Tax=Bordetella sp. BOR01 TaxID=2854779 RepID=UPI001C474F06|nr:amidohydrolase family protein [Bordetella sp. BOR01]MBV7483881.1 amidohydrolase family protein [Bordetella sp. BOR01]